MNDKTSSSVSNGLIVLVTQRFFLAGESMQQLLPDTPSFILSGFLIIPLIHNTFFAVSHCVGGKSLRRAEQKCAACRMMLEKEKKREKKCGGELLYNTFSKQRCRVSTLFTTGLFETCFLFFHYVTRQKTRKVIVQLKQKEQNKTTQ